MLADFFNSVFVFIFIFFLTTIFFIIGVRVHTLCLNLLELGKAYKKLWKDLIKIWPGLRRVWPALRSFFWKKEKISQEADVIAIEFGRKILREVRELGGDENDLVLGQDFEFRKKIARTIMRKRKRSIETQRTPNTIRQGDFVQVDAGVSVFPDCDTVAPQPPVADKKTKI